MPVNGPATTGKSLAIVGGGIAGLCGGLPTGVMTAREVLQLVCKRDGVAFRTTTV
jgi:hypothetical protein